MIMVIAMAVVVVLASLVLVFAQEMRMEAQAAGNRAALLQANAVTRGALAHLTNQLTTAQDFVTLDTSIQSQGVALGDGLFWIVRPNGDDEQQYDYGIQDENGKLNINTATYDMLMLLPNMSTELASSIIDWRDADEEITSNGGAENEYYLLLEDPYYCKNAPFETLEELLLVKGATRELLYGVDANHNGVVDEEEQNTKLSTGSSSGLTGLNGNARCGIMKYLTLYSQAPNVDSKGKARVNINTANTQQMSDLLGKAGIKGERIEAILGKLRSNRPFRSTADFYVKLDLKIDEFKKIADSITTDPRPIIPGLINVNTAPKEVLQCIPGIEASDADTIVSQRKSSGTDTSSYAWVFNLLSQTKLLQAAPFLTASSKRYSAEIVGVSGDGRAFKRSRVVFDASTTTPKLLYIKDQTHLGWPLEKYILEQIRAGNYAGQNTQGLPGSNSNTSGSSGLKGSGN